MKWLSLILVTLVSCASDEGPGQSEAPRLLAEVECNARYRCGCVIDDQRLEYSTEQECVDGYAELYAGLADPIPDSSYDGGCMQEWLDAHSTLACDVAAGGQELPTCNPVTGSRGEGEPCRSTFFGDNCRADLFCDPLEVVCKAPTRLEAALGEACGGEDVYCGDDLFCSDGTCEREVAQGESCADASCGEGLVCDGGVCVFGAGLGEPCGSGCGVDLRCDGDDGTCQTPPSAACRL